MTIGEWLERRGFSAYVDAFVDNGIDVALLPELDQNYLKELGVERLGDRKRLLRAIAQFQTAPTTPVAPSSEVGSPRVELTSPTHSTAPEHRSPTSDESIGEHRQLTVMFCDLAHSTELSTQMDPEDYREYIATFQGATAAVVRRFGGFIVRYMGDGILVYFGYPIASEGDTERAVAAALEIVQSVGLQSNGIRIGIATGTAIVGDLIGEGAARETTVVGETPNLAARLQGVAGVNRVLVSSVTQLLASGSFDFRSLGRLNLRGFTDSVEVFEVSGERSVESRFSAMRNHRATAIVGRETERMLILDRWRSAVSGEGQTVLVSGEAGIGKSRLIESCLQEIAGEATIIRYQCSPNHTDSPLFPATQQLRFAASIGPADSNADKLDKLEHLVRGSGETSDRAICLMAQLVGISFEFRYGPLDLAPDTVRTETLETLAAQLFRLSASRAVFFLFEDLHWIDPTSLMLLESSMDRLRDYRVLIVATHRPDWQPEYTGFRSLTTLQLNRLGRSKSAEIVRGIIGDFVSDEAVDRIVGRTDGIPLFIEEVTKTMVEGSLEPTERIPESLHASLLARIDRLDREARATAPLAAAIGREFSRDVLVAASPVTSEAVDALLARLMQSELITKSGSLSAPRFSFKHTLVQEVVYDSMLRSVRQAQHAAIADAIVGGRVDNDDVSPEMLARHYYESGEHEKAVTLWEEAGARYASISANAEAVAQFRRAINALEEAGDGDDERRFRLRMNMTGPLVAALGFTAEGTTEHVAASLELAQTLGDTREVFPILYGRYIAHALGGRLDAATNFAQEFLTLAKAEPEPELRMLGERLVGQVKFFLGEPDAAWRHLSSALDIEVPECGGLAAYYFGHDVRVGAPCYLALVCAHRGQGDDALSWTEKALERAESVSHPDTLGFVLLHQAIAQAWLARISDLSESQRRWRALDAEHGLAAWRPGFGVVDAYAAFLQGSPRAAIAVAEKAITANESRRFQFLLPGLMAQLAEVYLAEGDVDRALAWVERGLALTVDGERYARPELLRVRAEALLASGGSPADARQRLDEARNAALGCDAVLQGARIAKAYDRLVAPA
ncbi:MAG: AAA family ATPase [Pseudomonadota bacterium]